MGDPWSDPNKLGLFLAFFVPGFISLQIYGLFVAIDDSDLQKRLPAIVGHSAIHYALFGWIILVTPEGFLRGVAAYVVVLILPIFWPPTILLLREYERWRGIFFKKKSFILASFSIGIASGGVLVAVIYRVNIDPGFCVLAVGIIIIACVLNALNWSGILQTALKPEATPWDRILTAESRYVRIRLKSGPYVGGYFGPGSSVSTYPSEPEIFIVQACEINQETGKFISLLDNTGLLVRGSEIDYLETIGLPPVAEGGQDS